jgi:hypothetical protein
MRSDSQGMTENTRARYGGLFLQGNQAGKQNTPGACVSRGATGVYESIVTRAQSFATPVSMRGSHPRCTTQLRITGGACLSRDDGHVVDVCWRMACLRLSEARPVTVASNEAYSTRVPLCCHLPGRRRQTREPQQLLATAPGVRWMLLRSEAD